MLPEDRWMGRQVTDDYFLAHAINSTTGCYYDRRHPPDLVTIHDGLSGLGGRIATCICVSLLGMVPVIALSGSILCCNW
jgi:hypothetical protein